MADVRVTGGCQCGAVRYALHQEPGNPHICHCRMCQKAFGAFYGPYVSMKPEQVTWTRGERKLFASSNLVNRGFCGECGTQLTFEGSGFFDIAIGAFDDPSNVTQLYRYLSNNISVAAGDAACNTGDRIFVHGNVREEGLIASNLKFDVKVSGVGGPF